MSSATPSSAAGLVTASGRAGARPRVRVTGALRRVQVGGTGGAPVLRADLHGREGTVTIIWMGRDHIAGIEPGRSLAVEGTLSLQHGRKVIYNPRYEFLDAPAAAGERGTAPGQT